jgi:hypothetical protein
VGFLVESESRVLLGILGLCCDVGLMLNGIEYSPCIAEWNGMVVMEFPFGFMKVGLWGLLVFLKLSFGVV